MANHLNNSLGTQNLPILVQFEDFLIYCSSTEGRNVEPLFI